MTNNREEIMARIIESDTTGMIKKAHEKFQQFIADEELMRIYKEHEKIQESHGSKNKPNDHK